ncbi:MAG: NAD-dependent epimerase/dehydratase family protein [Desulfobacteraceae bacterium]
MNDLKSSDSVVLKDLEYICDNLKVELDKLAGHNLLITGGAGFLGYYLVQTITHFNRGVTNEQKICLTVFDNFSRGKPRWIAALADENELLLKTHDITNPLPDDMGDFDYIIHAASIASPTFYRQHPIETMDANVNGLRYLLEYCRDQKDTGKPISGFLFYSSSEVYGNPTPENIPTPETYNGYVSCTGPRACYDESKRYGETLCVNFARQLEIPVKIARPFNNYGPGLKITDRRVLPDFARDVLANQDIIMLSDGKPMRTFCYVADAIVGYYKILVNGKPGESYNIGTSQPEISMAQLAEKVVEISRELFGYTGIFKHQPSPEADYLVDNPDRRCPVITKAQTELGYNPSISLEEGLKRSLTWYADHRAGEDA